MGTEQSKLDFKQFAINLKEARGKAHLTQSALGEMVGLDKTQSAIMNAMPVKKVLFPILKTSVRLRTRSMYQSTGLLVEKKTIPKKQLQQK